MHTHTPERPAAVLVAVQLPEVSDEEHQADLAELGRLVHTLGFDVIAEVTQRRPRLAVGAVLGEGKLKELADITGGTGLIQSGAPPRKNKLRTRREREAAAAEEAAEEAEAAADGEADDEDADDEDDEGSDAASASGAAYAGSRRATVVVVDHEISPSQARNLERATSAEVMDRTGVIVEIFHRHARSREAKLQVEIARLMYVAPRMRESGGGAERQQGKGAGESALELDRRKIRDRIAELRHELASIQTEQDTRRAHRRDQRRVALVGYTNAGKSSLMRALTGSEVLVADKLFATLDTTVRALHPEVRPRILISDTVGFIKKLPHDLVASFRSTLDEALEASLLLYVADASDATFRQQLEVTQSVLKEIGVGDAPSLLLLNKVDRLGDAAREALASEFPEAVQLSAKRKEDVTALRERIIAFFDGAIVEEELLLPYSKQGLRGEIFEAARVLGESYDEAGARLRVRAAQGTMTRLKGLLAE
jgi:GTPase